MLFLKLLVVIIVLITIYMVAQIIRCNVLVRKSEERLRRYESKVANLSYGQMTYIEEGTGVVILSSHGIFGGYDQAYDICKDFVDDYRIVAPSRFGYLGSDVLGEGTPKEQAKAYIELLDFLGIDKVFILGTSAGGSVAIRFALDYPERTLGLILYSSAMPLNEKPNKIAKYVGPPKFLCNDYLMFLISPLFEPIMGMFPSTIYSMMPISKRKKGVVIDSSITNLDMAKNFDEYDIESIECSKLILHAKDDKLANYEDTVKVINRFTNLTNLSFDEGGHLLKGHGKEIKDAVKIFIESSNK